jgi:hypothetical protein
MKADIQALEVERDTLHTANKRDEQSLGNLRAELKKIQATYDEIQKANRDKLAALQHSVAALRARHQSMLKEIRESKYQEERLKSITSTYEKIIGQRPDSPQAQATSMDGLMPEQKLVASVTPQVGAADASPAAPTSPAPGQSSDLMSPSPSAAAVKAVSPTPATSASIPSPSSEPVKAAPSPARSAQQAPSQEQSWLSNLTAWLTSWFDWIWA